MSSFENVQLEQNFCSNYILYLVNKILKIKYEKRKKEVKILQSK